MIRIPATITIAITLGWGIGGCEKADTAAPPDAVAPTEPTTNPSPGSDDPLDDHQRGDAGNYAFGGQSDDGATVQDSGPVIDPTVSTEGSLGPDAVTDAVNQRMDEVGACYQQAMERRRTEDIAGIVAVTFTVERSGKVSGATVSEESIGDPELSACIVRAVSGWTFPSPPDGDATVVRFPFELRNH